MPKGTLGTGHFFHTSVSQCLVFYAYFMAKNPKFTPRTKHIAIKYHHFRKHVRSHSNPDGFIDICYCSTQEQIADIFTKPTSDDIF